MNLKKLISDVREVDVEGKLRQISLDKETLC
jgi:hypothetical protein